MSGFEQGYALIIGIANYAHVRRLPAVVLQDAQDVYDLLCSPSHGGYLADQVRLLLDAEASIDALRDGLRWLAQRAGSGASALVFFSGHGGQVRSGPHAGNYLLPWGCIPENLPETALSGRELTAQLHNIQAQRLLVFFDSCYSGGAGEPKTADFEAALFKLGLEEIYYEQLAQGTGRVIIASSRSDEVSLVLPGMGNSLFTHCLLEALRGKARSRGDGFIRVLDVFDYVSETVPARGLQHPILKATDLENNFPIALHLGGQPKHVLAPTETTVDKRQLRRAMVQYFSVEDLAVLCADVEQGLAEDGIELQVNLDVVGGIGQEAKALNLIRYLDKHRVLASLVRVMRRERPGII